MPYKIVKARGGYYVKNMESGHTFSNKPIPYDHALGQMAALQLRKRGVPPRKSPARRSPAKGRKSPARRSPAKGRKSSARRSPRRYSMPCGCSGAR